ncbi:hypothetical protein FB567DRAFT_547920 [Paraphoma chrysanthemicola]|uniref:Uncharacterized protein n=1 Tax=Paraphoma chrysanthemicola TaxID=798071 RepID=A0A8K0RBF8_9PLEO|nr:hypothetical protein FB567DRAFT_547920 [Paraphoma chrysanthemicola]
MNAVLRLTAAGMIPGLMVIQNYRSINGGYKKSVRERSSAIRNEENLAHRDRTTQLSSLIYEVTEFATPEGIAVTREPGCLRHITWRDVRPNVLEAASCSGRSENTQCVQLHDRIARREVGLNVFDAKQRTIYFRQSEALLRFRPHHVLRQVKDVDRLESFEEDLKVDTGRPGDDCMGTRVETSIRDDLAHTMIPTCRGRLHAPRLSTMCGSCSEQFESPPLKPHLLLGAEVAAIGEEDTCAACLESLRDGSPLVSGGCAHVMHRKCMLKGFWLWYDPSDKERLTSWRNCKCPPVDDGSTLLPLLWSFRKPQKRTQR